MPKKNVIIFSLWFRQKNNSAEFEKLFILKLTSSPKHGEGAHPITESSAATIHPLPLHPIDRIFQPDKSWIGFGYIFASFEEVY